MLGQFVAPGTMEPVSVVGVEIVSALAVGLLSYFFVERRLLRLMKGRARFGHETAQPLLARADGSSRDIAPVL
jgi:peptidoglycan/LPS O-acetylase OafA/YrhL